MSKHLKTINPDFKLYDFFDMYAGTSIGALIILLILVRKYDEKELLGVFNKDMCQTIMDKTIWDKMLGLIQSKPKYNGKGKLEKIKHYIKDHKFADLTKFVVIPPYNISKQKTKIFYSDETDSDILTSEIADATSASPGYFPCVQICNKNSENCWFIDGGIVANNPTISAISKAKKILRDDSTRKIVVLNIGTGQKTRYIDGEKAKDYGGIEWLVNNLIGISMDESVIYEQAKDLLYDDHYININGKLNNVSDDMDDCSDENLENLIKMGEDWWIEHKHKFKDFFYISNSI
jgi:patatin-like phospholipase/acyl hydrolase